MPARRSPESTKVPEGDAMEEDMEEVLVEGPPSDNETATSTKRSQSKPEHARGPTRQAKQAKKALIHKGILSKEEAESLSAVEVMDMVKKHRQGSSMLSEVLLQQLEENKKENLLAKLFGEHTETPDMKVPKITDEQVREAARRPGEVPVLQEDVGRVAHPEQVAHLHEGAPPVQLLAAGRSHLHECRGRGGLASSSEAIRGLKELVREMIKNPVIRFKREPVLKSKPCKKIRVKTNDSRIKGHS